MVRQQDIADELGLSRTLVSKVLNGRLGTTRVRTETINAIWATARRLGYRPNSTAVSLATGRQGAIGVCIRHFGNRASRLADDIAEGVIEAAAAAGQKLMMVHFTEDSISPGGQSIVPLLDSGVLDGLILAGFLDNDTSGLLSEFRRLPVVFIRSQSILRAGSTHIGVNEIALTRIATEHLIAKGCRRIAAIRGRDNRHQGYRDALTAAGMPYREELIFDIHAAAPDSMFSYAAGKLAAEYFLDRRLDFDALATESDEQAMAVMNELVKHGVRVGEDVRITGVDNSPQCEFAICPLTSVDQNLREAGRRGFELLMDRIARRPNIPDQVMVEPFLAPRASTA